MRDIAINRIMTTDPVTIGPDAAVATAIELLESCDIHHLPVVVDGVLTGIPARFPASLNRQPALTLSNWLGRSTGAPVSGLTTG